jgi:chemotaxis protein methyltransferase CheR
MSGEDARLLQEIIHEHCGVSHGLDSEFFLERRCGPRLDALGLSSYREYYHYLRYDPGGPRELEELIERITTHETYFFREQYQLDAFTEEILPELRERNRRHRSLTLWSAGCSTGEEVYTVAMLMLEKGVPTDWSVRVVGSDISRKVLAKARRGVYTSNSFRTTSPELRRRYFDETGGESRVRENVRSLCSFGQLNLVDTGRLNVIGPCDVIFCRNVLIYLSTEARLRVVAAFFDLLRPGGYLLLGHSESLLHLTTRFEIAHLERDLVYRKPPRPGDE